ncbi:MAG: site-2 protease family protein [Anaerolineales bacterium]|nr:site-2 protease family protein [Anaerolineales bacterium]
MSTLIARLVVLATAFTVHEFAHAWTADRFGDNTPRVNGRLSLNPLVHLDPMGSLLLLVAGFGWAKPVPVNPYVLNRRSPAALMWVSLAGPLSNFLMALIAAIPFRLDLVSYQQAVSDSYTAGQHLLPTLPQFLFEFIAINLVLMLFNLIPLAPLDGDKIAAYFFPPAWAETLERIRPYGPLLLLALFMAGPLIGIDIIGWMIRPAMNFLFDLLVL